MRHSFSCKYLLRNFATFQTLLYPKELIYNAVMHLREFLGNTSHMEQYFFLFTWLSAYDDKIILQDIAFISSLFDLSLTALVIGAKNNKYLQASTFTLVRHFFQVR